METGDGVSHAFRSGQNYRLVEAGAAPGYPRRQTQDWPGLPDTVGAALTWRQTQVTLTYFFSGERFWKYKGSFQIFGSAYTALYHTIQDKSLLSARYLSLPRAGSCWSVEGNPSGATGPACRLISTQQSSTLQTTISTSSKAKNTGNSRRATLME